MDNFYFTFEKNFRGTPEQILERLRAYDDFLIPLLQTQVPAMALDLGCGRGEWLGKLYQLGFKVHGVDLDEAMLQSCREKGFQVTCQDALTYLHSLPDESQSIVTAFHMVEHITFENLRHVLDQALRVLKPAGLLVMETPNPENLIVATRNFYLDPTHTKPIPPELLTFLARYAGFNNVKLIRLQENPSIVLQQETLLADVINGVSPDYAIIAQKIGSSQKMSQFEKAFLQDKGVGLQTMVDRFDRTLQTRHDTIVQQIEFKDKQFFNISKDLKFNSEKINSFYEQLEIKTEQLLKFSYELEIKSEQISNLTLRVQQLQEQSQKIQCTQMEILFYQQKTLEWKVSQFIIWLTLQFDRLRQQGLRRRTFALVKKMIFQLKKHLDKNPQLRKSTLAVLKKTRLYFLVKKFTRQSISDRSYEQTTYQAVKPNRQIQSLSARALKLKAEIKDVMTKQENL